MEQDQKKLQQMSETLQKLQDDLQTSISTRQTLTSQQSESQAVQKEFASKSTSSEQPPRVYRLLGPILLSQEHSDAQNTVSSRLSYISNQLADTDIRIRDLQSQSQKIQGDMVGLQQKMQQDMAAQQQQGEQQQSKQVAQKAAG